MDKVREGPGVGEEGSIEAVGRSAATKRGSDADLGAQQIASGGYTGTAVFGKDVKEKAKAQREREALAKHIA